MKQEITKLVEDTMQTVHYLNQQRWMQWTLQTKGSRKTTQSSRTQSTMKWNAVRTKSVSKTTNLISITVNKAWRKTESAIDEGQLTKVKEGKILTIKPMEVLHIADREGWMHAMLSD